MKNSVYVKYLSTHVKEMSLHICYMILWWEGGGADIQKCVLLLFNVIFDILNVKFKSLSETTPISLL